MNGRKGVLLPEERTAAARLEAVKRTFGVTPK